MRLVRVILSVVALPLSVTMAGDEQAGTQSPFAFGVGARELALGRSMISLCDPAVAPFWNPSRLASTEHTSLGGFYTALYGDEVSYQYLGVAIPTLDFGSLGVGVFQMGVSGIERLDENSLLLGSFDDSRLGIYLAYARQLSSYNCGIAFSIEHHSLAGYSATSSPGVHLSLGRNAALFGGLFRTMSFALNMRNVVPPGTKLLDEDVKYPLTVDFSTGVVMIPDQSRHSLLLSVAASKARYGDVTVNAGLEYEFVEMLKLRGGLSDGRISLGGGIHYSSFALDYAVAERSLGSTHLFSVTMTLGKSVEERKLARASQRESEFQEAMARQLERQNRHLAEQYLNEGKALLAHGSLDSALTTLDRALFVTRSANCDTVEIAGMLVQAQTGLAERERMRRVDEHLDSARANLSAGAYMQAQYYARLARQADSLSAEAARLLGEATAAVRDAENQSEFVERRLLEIDSLLACEQVEQAAQIVQSVVATAGSSQILAQLVRRIHFEGYRLKAQKLISANNFSRGLVYSDSALAIYPSHSVCLDLRDLCRQSLKKSAVAVKQQETAPTGTSTVSGAVLKEVEDSYRRGQKLFEQGSLGDATAYWERVERMAPDFQRVREYLVRSYKFLGIQAYGQNRLTEALDYWRKAAVLDPENAEISSYVSRAQNELQKLKALSYESN